MNNLNKICLITGCSRKKEKGKHKAYILYKSPRIRQLFEISYLLNIPLYILSGKYGLIPATREISYYDKIMKESEIEKFSDQAKEILKLFDIAIYFAWGSRKIYIECILLACKKAKTNCVILGKNSLEELKYIPGIIEILKNNEITQIKDLLFKKYNCDVYIFKE